MAGSSGDAPLTPVKSTPLPFGKGRKGKGDLEAGTIQLEITPSKSNSKIAELRANRDEIKKTYNPPLKTSSLQNVSASALSSVPSSCLATISWRFSLFARRPKRRKMMKNDVK